MNNTITKYHKLKSGRFIAVDFTFKNGFEYPSNRRIIKELPLGRGYYRRMSFKVYCWLLKKYKYFDRSLINSIYFILICLANRGLI